MATSTKGYGTQLLRTTSTATAATQYVAYSDLLSVTPPSLERADVDDSDLDSASQAREYVAGWIEPGEVPFSGRFTKTQYNAILTDFAAGTNLYWRVDFPLIDSEAAKSMINFRGHVKAVGFDEANVDDDNLVTCQFAIKVTGLPTFTAGS